MDERRTGEAQGGWCREKPHESRACFHHCLWGSQSPVQHCLSLPTMTYHAQTAPPRPRPCLPHSWPGKRRGQRVLASQGRCAMWPPVRPSAPQGAALQGAHSAATWCGWGDRATIMRYPASPQLHPPSRPPPPVTPIPTHWTVGAGEPDASQGRSKDCPTSAATWPKPSATRSCGGTACRNHQWAFGVEN